MAADIANQTLPLPAPAPAASDVARSSQAAARAAARPSDPGAGGRSFEGELSRAPASKADASEAPATAPAPRRDGAAKEALAPLRRAAMANRQQLEQVPVLKLITGHLESLPSADIPDLVTGNRFLADALGQADVAKFLAKPMALADLAQALDLPKSLLQDAQQQGLDLAQMVTPGELLQSLGIDPQRVFAELKLLKDNVALDGVSGYVDRATALAAKDPTRRDAVQMPRADFAVAMAGKMPGGGLEPPPVVMPNVGMPSPGKPAMPGRGDASPASAAAFGMAGANPFAVSMAGLSGLSMASAGAAQTGVAAPATGVGGGLVAGVGAGAADVRGAVGVDYGRLMQALRAPAVSGVGASEDAGAAMALTPAALQTDAPSLQNATYDAFQALGDKLQTLDTRRVDAQAFDLSQSTATLTSGASAGLTAGVDALGKTAADGMRAGADANATLSAAAQRGDAAIQDATRRNTAALSVDGALPIAGADVAAQVQRLGDVRLADTASAVGNATNAAAATVGAATAGTAASTRDAETGAGADARALARDAEATSDAAPRLDVTALRASLTNAANPANSASTAAGASAAAARVASLFGARAATAAPTGAGLGLTNGAEMAVADPNAPSLLSNLGLGQQSGVGLSAPALAAGVSVDGRRATDLFAGLIGDARGMRVATPADELRLAAPVAGLKLAVAPDGGNGKDAGAGDGQEGAGQGGLGTRGMTARPELTLAHQAGRAHDAGGFAAHLQGPEAPLTPSDRLSLMQKVADHATMLAKSGGGTVRLDLGSPELGPLEMAINLDKDRIDLRVVAGSARVRDAMMADLGRLKDALGVQNIRLGNVEVGVNHRQQPSPQQQMQQQQQRQPGQSGFAWAGNGNGNGGGREAPADERRMPSLAAVRAVQAARRPAGGGAAALNALGRIAVRA